MNPASLSLRTSAGGRPNSLFRSASEYSCISPHRFEVFFEDAASRDAGAFLGALRSAASAAFPPRAFKLAFSTSIRSTTLETPPSTLGGFREGHFLALDLALHRRLDARFDARQRIRSGSKRFAAS